MGSCFSTVSLLQQAGETSGQQKAHKLEQGCWAQDSGEQSFPGRGRDFQPADFLCGPLLGKVVVCLHVSLLC